MKRRADQRSSTAQILSSTEPAFLSQQHDRTRQAVAMLAAGYKRCEVADRLGITAPAITQRMDRVEREWDRFQGGQEGEAPEETTGIRDPAT